VDVDVPLWVLSQMQARYAARAGREREEEAAAKAKAEVEALQRQQTQTRVYEKLRRKHQEVRTLEQ
jgi:hypothetical protein